jgi:Ca2+-binding RTX toxin-like protein
MGRRWTAAVAVSLLGAATLTFSPSGAGGADCTVKGTSGRDELAGTSQDDVICGFGGSDVIEAKGGDDVVRGGKGRDEAKGGRGADRLLGGRGRDALEGGAGADEIRGGAGPDGGWGDSGSDRIYGGPGEDSLLVGWKGRDIIRGGDTGDYCIVVSDDRAPGDVVDGGPGFDNVFANPGDIVTNAESDECPD